MSKKAIYGLSGIIAVVIIAVAVLLVTQSSSDNNEQDHTDISNQGMAQEKLQGFKLDKQPVKGDRQAPVQIVEVGDYKCPLCKTWTQTVFPQLEEKYVQTGKAAFYYVGDAFLGPDSMTAAMAAEYMKGQSDEAFWKFHDLLMDNQGSKDEEWATVDYLTQLVETHLPEIDATLFKQSLEKKEFEPQVKEDMEASIQYKVERVPAIFVNGKLVDGPSLEESVAAIEEELRRINEE